MNELTHLTTRQAAGLIQVHESSIKRWCKQDELAFTLTEGGHRRIDLGDLMDFARSRAMPCMLASLAPHESSAWESLRNAQTSGNFENLRRLIQEWLKSADPALVGRLIHFCQEQGFSLSTLFDAVVTPVLHRVGDEWHAGKLEIGEEHRITEVFRDILHEIRMQLSEANGLKPHGALAIVGCSEGNLHDLGAQVVRILLEQRGWHIIYLGANVPIVDFATLQASHHARLVCISIVPPSIVSDAERHIDLLARFYDTDNPYHLVLGGQMLSAPAPEHFSRSPFLSVQAHTTTDAFARWLDSNTHLPVD